MSRSRSAMMNWLSAVFFTLTTMATGFIVTPMIFAPLGEDRYGLVRALSEVLGYFSMIVQGLSVSLVPMLARSVGVGDKNAARRYLSAGLWCYGVAACVVVVLALALLPALNVIIPTTPALHKELRIAWLISVAGFPLVLAMPLRLVMEIHHRGYLVNVATLVQSLTISILSVVLVRSGWGVPGVMTANMVGMLCFTLIVLLINWRDYPDLFERIHRVKVLREDVRSITSLSWPTFVTMASQRLGMLSDSILVILILGPIAGPAAAAILFLNQRLASIVEGILRAFSGATWPSLVELNARGEHELFNLRMKELSRLVMILAVAALVPVVFYNKAFLMLWIGPKSQPSTSIAVVAAINTLLMTITALFSTPLVCTGNVKLLAVPSIIAATLNIAVSSTLTYMIGPVGTLVGTTCSLALVDLWYYPKFLQRTFGTSPSAIFQACIVPLAWGLPYAGVVAFLAHEAEWIAPLLGRITGIFLILGFMGASSLLFLVFSVVVIFTAEERTLWNERFLIPLRSRFGY